MVIRHSRLNRVNLLEEFIEVFICMDIPISEDEYKVTMLTSLCH